MYFCIDKKQDRNWLLHGNFIYPNEYDLYDLHNFQNNAIHISHHAVRNSLHFKS